MSSDEPTLKPTPRHDELEQCPRCKIPAWDCEQAYGIAPRYLTESVVACPNCHGTIVVKGGAEKGEAEMLEGEPEASISSQVADVLREDRQRGSGQASSSSGSQTRDKPRAKIEVRWEQEPPIFSNTRGGGDITVVERLEKPERTEISLTTETKFRLSRYVSKASRQQGRRVTMAEGIRLAVSVQGKRVAEVYTFDQSVDKKQINIYLLPSEITFIDSLARAHAVDGMRVAFRGEVIEACLLKWLPSVE